MSPIPYASINSRLIPRDDSSDDSADTCTGFCSDGYIRWIVAIIIILFVIALIVVVWGVSVKRVTGRWGFRREFSTVTPDTIQADDGIIRRGTRRHRRHRRGTSNPDDSDPVPVYNATPGQNDAGYYDANGTYIAHEPPPYEPPKALLRHDEVEMDRMTTSSEATGTDEHAPPPHPPPPSSTRHNV